MTERWNELRPKFEFFSRPFPHEAVAQAHAHREEIAPRLVEALECIAADPEPARDGEYMLHLYAMHLLAAWRDTRAYRPLVRLGRHSEKVVEDLMGDVVTEAYGRCLASVCDGDLAPLKALAEDAAASFWARGAAMDAMTVRVLEGDCDRDALVDYLAEYGDAETARLRAADTQMQDLEMLDRIVCTATDIGASALLERIRGWYADGLLDITVADQPGVERDLATAFDTHRQRHAKRGRGYIRDVAEEMGWWAGFAEEDSPRRDHLQQYADRMPDTYIRPGPKTGRNDPCPCGSGKKYKKCHGANA